MSRPTAARGLLGLSMVLAWGANAFQVTPWDHLPHPYGLARVLPLSWALDPVAYGLLTLPFLGAVLAWVLRWREDLAGWTALAFLWLSITLEMSILEIFMPQLEAMLAGGLLTTWQLSRWVGRRRGLEGPALDSFGHEVVAGAFGAMLSLAAMSKLWVSGLDWVDGRRHAGVIFEHALVAQGPLASFRGWVATMPWLASVGAVYTLVVEACGFVYIWPALRKPAAWLVALVFVFIAVFTAIYEVSWATMAFALAYSHLGEREDP